MSSATAMAMTLEDLRLLNRKQAAAFIKERISAGSVAWLAKLARTNAGPAFKIIASRALYRPEDLEAWLLQQWHGPSESCVLHDPVSHEGMTAEPLPQYEELGGEDADVIADGLRIAALAMGGAP